MKGSRSAYPYLIFLLTLTAASGLTIWPQVRGQGPNPNPQPITVQISSSSYSVGEADDTVTITVTLDQSPSQTVTVDFATSNGTATGDANGGADGGDYQTVSGTLTFLSGQTSKTLVIDIYDGDCCEPNETFTVTLSNPSGATLGSPSTSTVTIIDDDTGCD